MCGCKILLYDEHENWWWENRKQTNKMQPDLGVMNGLQLKSVVSQSDLCRYQGNQELWMDSYKIPHWGVINIEWTSRLTLL